MTNHIDDEIEETEEESDTSELEAEFKAHWEKHEAEIQKHVDKAYKSLQKAIALADEHGIPFYSSVSFLGQNYTPAVLKKFADLDQQTIDDITGTYNEYGGEGWQHSDVC